ncbi:hypothetical protein BU14_0231s0014 [Porphyra umbilicalis]|uniref:Uncharacterized protein n=1 Tax=Porphyra umbilicalis TaxID=2786 RepID=A0A1X6P3V4_PORUM|nr:hypothetical protein BU14_0231s0014 [Porphyra umbilicalis]|eukprot:OSX75561.1 hypothetical protein BU14_0231s0014 [Porphyra umbilicalis]
MRATSLPARASAVLPCPVGWVHPSARTRRTSAFISQRPPKPQFPRRPSPQRVPLPHLARPRGAPPWPSIPSAPLNFFASPQSTPPQQLCRGRVGLRHWGGRRDRAAGDERCATPPGGRLRGRPCLAVGARPGVSPTSSRARRPSSLLGTGTDRQSFAHEHQRARACTWSSLKGEREGDRFGRRPGGSARSYTEPTAGNRPAASPAVGSRCPSRSQPHHYRGARVGSVRLHPTTAVACTSSGNAIPPKPRAAQARGKPNEQE